MRARLRVSYTGQCVPDAQAGHQDAEEGPGPAGARVQDVQPDQKSHTSRAQGPVRREKRMRRLVYVVVSPPTVHVQWRGRGQYLHVRDHTGQSGRIRLCVIRAWDDFFLPSLSGVCQSPVT